MESAFGIQFANAVVYAVGPRAAWLAGNRVFIGAVSGALLSGLVVVSIIGLRVTKWLHNGASVLLMLGFALLFALPFINMARGTLREFHPFAVTAPALTLLNHQITSVTQYWPLVLGTVLIVLLFAFPGGILGMLKKRDRNA